VVCERQHDNVLARLDEYNEEREPLHQQPLDPALAEHAWPRHTGQDTFPQPIQDQPEFRAEVGSESRTTRLIPCSCFHGLGGGSFEYPRRAH
jgi:hypothetical protein